MAEKIFITGATGFVAGALIERLLEARSADRLAFLVRAATPADGLARLKRSLSRFRAPQERLARLSAADIVCGDLLDPRPWLDDPRVASATRIVNCGASTSFGQDRMAWAVNYEGTLELVRAVRRHGSLRRFLHVGTAMSCGPLRSGLVEESMHSDPAKSHYAAYTASKAAFEQHVREEFPDFPMVIARPSIVLGHTVLGCGPSASIYWILRMARDIGGFACERTDTIDLVPVDWVATALETLLYADSLKNDLYHLSAGARGRISFAEIDRAFAEAAGEAPLDARYRRIGADELHGAVQLAGAALSRSERRLAAFALALYGEFARLSYTFCNRRILAEGLPQPARLPQYLKVCVQTARQIPLGEQIRTDVKLLRTGVARGAASRAPQALAATG